MGSPQPHDALQSVAVRYPQAEGGWFAAIRAESASQPTHLGDADQAALPCRCTLPGVGPLRLAKAREPGNSGCGLSAGHPVRLRAQGVSAGKVEPDVCLL